MAGRKLVDQDRGIDIDDDDLARRDVFAPLARARIFSMMVMPIAFSSRGRVSASLQ